MKHPNYLTWCFWGIKSKLGRRLRAAFPIIYARKISKNGSHIFYLATVTGRADPMKTKRNKPSREAYSLHLPSTHSLNYKYVGERRRGLSAKEQTFLIDGQHVPYSYHPLSLHGTNTKKARPRVQLTDEHAARLQLPIVDERSGDVTKIIFPNGRVNYVLMARRNSNCPALRALHKHMDEHRAELDDFLSKLDTKRLKDEVGGGRYVVSGFGNMGKNVSATIRPPNQPALRKSLKLAEHEKLAKLVGAMFSSISECIAMHCKDVYEQNHELMINKNLAWPPEKYQKSTWYWMSSQFIVRRWGPAFANDWPLENDLVAAHTDAGDLDCNTFSCYMTGGGRAGKGGPVAGTDFVAFEKAVGGAGFRVKTCIEDTVVVVVMNSRQQLHGCIKSSDDFVEDGSAWTTRIIPYIPQGVYNWMKRHPNGTPFVDIP